MAIVVEVRPIVPALKPLSRKQNSRKSNLTHMIKRSTRPELRRPAIGAHQLTDLRETLLGLRLARQWAKTAIVRLQNNDCSLVIKTVSRQSI